jgi:hypothetical protein
MISKKKKSDVMFLDYFQTDKKVRVLQYILCVSILQYVMTTKMLDT